MNKYLNKKTSTFSCDWYETSVFILKAAGAGTETQQSTEKQDGRPILIKRILFLASCFLPRH